MGKDPSELVEIKVNPRSGDKTAARSSTPPARVAEQPRRDGDGFSDYRPFKRWSSWLVPGFVAINVVLFIITMYVNNCPKHSVSCIPRFLGRLSFQPFNENPLLGPSANALDKMGALEVSKIVQDHQTWRLLSCIWLHAGVFHILANMLSLVFIGIRLEQEFGFVRIGLLYFVSGFGGSLMSALFIQDTISVGASGALFGLLGGMLSELITNWTIYANKLAALLTLIFIIVINLGMGILPHVDNYAHIGGFLSGFFLGFVFLIRPQFRWISQKNAPPEYYGRTRAPKYKTYQYVLWVISLLLLIAGFSVGLVWLFKGVNVNDHCPWCHYLSCVPTSSWSCESPKVSCEAIQFDNQLNLTCTSNGRSKLYPIPETKTHSLEQLCSRLCG